MIAASLVGAAWSLITFMAVPVITFEGTGPWTTLKRSATLFKDRWAGQVTGNVAIGGIVFLLGVLPAILLIAIGVYRLESNDGGGSLAGGAVIVVIGVALLAVSMLVLQALRGVFGVALYRFATDGEVPAGYTQEELESAVSVRGARRHQQPRIVRADPVDAEGGKLGIRTGSSTVQATTATPTRCAA